MYEHMNFFVWCINIITTHLVSHNYSAQILTIKENFAVCQFCITGCENYKAQNLQTTPNADRTL